MKCIQFSTFIILLQHITGGTSLVSVSSSPAKAVLQTSVSLRLQIPSISVAATGGVISETVAAVASTQIEVSASTQKIVVMVSSAATNNNSYSKETTSLLPKPSASKSISASCYLPMNGTCVSVTMVPNKSFVSMSSSAGDKGNTVTLKTQSVTMVIHPSAFHSISIRPSSATIHFEMSSSVAATTTTTTTTTTLKPKVAPQNCNEVQGGFCQNGGMCYNKTISESGDKTKPACVCESDYYGDNCEKEITPPIYKQLTYAFGGTTIFLLIVVIALVCCKCQKRKRGKGELAFSEELDNFSVTNKRASAVFPSASLSSKPQTVNVTSYDNNIDMYGD